MIVIIINSDENQILRTRYSGAYQEAVTPGMFTGRNPIKFSISRSCSVCYHINSVPIPLWEEFFIAATSRKEMLQSELLTLFSTILDRTRPKDASKLAAYYTYTLNGLINQFGTFEDKACVPTCPTKTWDATEESIKYYLLETSYGTAKPTWRVSELLPFRPDSVPLPRGDAWTFFTKISSRNYPPQAHEIFLD